MAIVLEADAVLDAIIANLKADTGAGGVSHADLTGGRVYRDVAPSESTPYPIVTVSLLSAVDYDVVGGDHEFAQVLILTKVTDKTSDYRKTITIAKRVAVRLAAIERQVQDGVYMARVRRREVVSQPSDYVTVGGATVRYIYHNQTWYTEAAPVAD